MRVKVEYKDPETVIILMKGLTPQMRQVETSLWAGDGNPTI